MNAYTNYIYYYQKNFIKYQDKNPNIANLLKITKEDILSSAIEEQNWRQEQTFSDISGDDVESLHNILHAEEIIKKLNSSEQEPPLSMNMTYKDVSVALKILYDALDSKNNSMSQEIIGEKISTFITDLNKALRGQLGGESFQKLYEQAIEDRYYSKEFSKKSGYGVKSAKKIKSSLLDIKKQSDPPRTQEEKAYWTLMASKSSNRLFQIQDADQFKNLDFHIGTSLSKILSLFDLLEGVHKPSSNEMFETTNWDNVAERIRKWINQYQAEISEIFVAQGIINSTSEFFELLEKTMGIKRDDNTVRIVGSSNRGTGFDIEARQKNDPLLKQMFDTLQENRDKVVKGSLFKARNRTSVSDVEYGIKNSGSYVGITVKDYETVHPKDNEKAVNIHIQSGTSLLVLLLREAEFSSKNLLTFMNIGAAIPTEEDSLIAEWEAAKEQLTYRAVLNSLAGFRLSDDKAFYMSLNGYILTIQQVLGLMRDTLKNGKMQDTAKLTVMRNDEFLTGQGLERSALQSINKNAYEPPRKGMKTKDLARMRSDTAQSEIIQEFNRTKLQVSISFVGLAELLGI